jgi:2-phosphoxylose phosphatase
LTRTFQSAVAFMYGFEPHLDMSRFPHVERADNCTMCTPDTGHQCQCDFIGTRYMDSFAPSFGQTQPEIRNLPGAHRIASTLGLSDTQLPKLSHVFDVSMTHFCHHMTPNCLGTSLARDVFDVMKDSGRHALFDEQYQHICRLKMQPLLYEIAHRMTSSQSHRFVLYSGHDSTIEPLADVLGVSDGRWPRYASRLIFELYLKWDTVSTVRKYYVRILYNGRDVTDSVSFCKGQLVDGTPGLCPLDMFIKFVEQDQYNGGPGRTGYARECKRFRKTKDSIINLV